MEILLKFLTLNAIPFYLRAEQLATPGIKEDRYDGQSD